MAPHGQVGLQQDAEIAHRGRWPYQGPTDTQLSGVKVDTPSAGRTPQEVRLLGVKPQSVGTHSFGYPLNTNRNCKLLISRAPTKAKSQEPAYSQALNQNKIDRQRSGSRESGRQASYI